MAKANVKNFIIKGGLALTAVLALMGSYYAGALFGIPGGHSSPSAPDAKAHVEEAPEAEGPLAYYVMEEPMTVNLAHSERIAQIQLAFSGHGGAEFSEGLKSQDAAVRSALLMLLGDIPYEQMESAENKRQLLVKMRIAANRALEGSGFKEHIVQVHYVSFVVQ